MTDHGVCQLCRLIWLLVIWLTVTYLIFGLNQTPILFVGAMFLSSWSCPGDEDEDEEFED
jgi:hypothetical protein